MSATGNSDLAAPPWQDAALPQAGGRRSRVGLRAVAFTGSFLAWLAMFLVVILALFHNARQSAQAETTAAFQLASASAMMRMPVAFERRDVMAEAALIAAETDGLRHVSAMLTDMAGQEVLLPQTPLEPAGAPPPGWFARLLTPPLQEEFVPIRQYPNVLGMISIRTDPSDVIAQAWQNFWLVLPLLGATALVSLAMTMTVTALVLRQLRLIGQAMQRMGEGDLAPHAPDSHLTELADLSQGINALASSLAAQRAENRQLQGRMMSLAEDERARIASDLHDEIGPQLFALRAACAQANGAAQHVSGAGSAELAEALAAVERHSGAIRESARAAIDNLRLAPVEGADLHETLAELVLDFADVAPEVDIRLRVKDVPVLDEASHIAIHRFVRESVLNALRHAQPARITVLLAQAPAGHALIRVSDDGTGPSGKGPGMGLSGMQDRATALGAIYLPPRREGITTVTELRIPAS